MSMSLFGSIADSGIDPVADVIAAFFGNIEGIGLRSPFGLAVPGDDDLAAVQGIVGLRLSTG